MASTIYLAMTASEFAAADPLPPKIGWMACHFSPYGTGLSNLPSALPPGSLLILNDRIPICGHDPERIADQLTRAAEVLGCAGVLLDFQTQKTQALQTLAASLVTSLPCPVAVSEGYAEDLDCPVFLPPCPHHIHLQEHIEPWRGRELWLDLAADAETITLTGEGAMILPLPLGEIPEGGRRDERLHCHYSIKNTENTAQFTLWRSPKDLEALVKEAEELGIGSLVGLYQELY